MEVDSGNLGMVPSVLGRGLGVSAGTDFLDNREIHRVLSGSESRLRLLISQPVGTRAGGLFPH